MAPRRPGVPALLTAVLLALLALTGCTITVETPAPPSGAPQSGDGAGTGAESGADRPVSAGADQLDEDEQTAVNAVNQYWERHFSELSRQPYTPPRVAGPYVGRSGPSCGGQPSVPGNAFYCPPGDFLAWDQDLMRAGYDRIGDAWVYLVIAHEWGHAIQARLRANQVSVAAELQADCLAGASILGSVQDGVLVLEPGDEQELAQTLAAVADDYPWTDEGSHGNAQQRIRAFEAGANGGLRACV